MLAHHGREGGERLRIRRTEYGEPLRTPEPGERPIRVEKDQEFPPIKEGTEIDGGRYIIAEKIGEGGMGTVYLAERPNGLFDERGRELSDTVAIKFMRPEYLRNKTMVRSFERELGALKAFRDHPNIVKVTDEVQEPARGIVMEYMPGDLKHFVTEQWEKESGKIDESFVCTVGRQISSALETIHAGGIVHGDLKPENVFVKTAYPVGVGVADAGLAGIIEKVREVERPVFARDIKGEAPLHEKWRRENEEEKKDSPPFEGLTGAPEYLTPEYLHYGAKSGGRTERADLYALGTLLYWMLAKAGPYAHMQAKGRLDYMKKKIFEEPLSINMYTGHEEERTLIEAMIMTLIAKNPEARETLEWKGEHIPLKTASDVKRAIERVVEEGGFPVTDEFRFKKEFRAAESRTRKKERERMAGKKNRRIGQPIGPEIETVSDDLAA